MTFTEHQQVITNQKQSFPISAMKVKNAKTISRHTYTARRHTEYQSMNWNIKSTGQRDEMLEGPTVPR